MVGGVRGVGHACWILSGTYVLSTRQGVYQCLKILGARSEFDPWDRHGLALV